MASVSKMTTTSKMRQSCDRCHGQKLRCVNAGDSDTGACNRCRRSGAHCVYSSSLPKGRPNIYCLADTLDASSDLPSITAITPKLRRRPPVSSRSATAVASIDANANANANANMYDDAIMAEFMDSVSTRPWLEQLDLDSIQVEGSVQDPSQYASSLHTNFAPRTNASAAFVDPFPSLQGWIPMECSEVDDDALEAAPSLDRLHAHDQRDGGGLFERSSSSSNNYDSMIIEKEGSDVSIARLSQLSTRLYLLHRSSCALAETASLSAQSSDSNRNHRSPLIDDAAFNSVVAWLVQVFADMTLSSRTDCPTRASETTTTGDTLHGVFSASHDMLKILRCLDVEVKSRTLSSTSNVSTSTGGADLDFWASLTPQSVQSTSIPDDNKASYLEHGPGSSSYASTSSQYSNTAVRHLVIACHTLLLNIYVAVLIALQHDVDGSSSRRSAADNINTNTHTEDVAVLGEMRPVLTVQLCSYLIERQHKAVDTYLSPISPIRLQQQHNLSAPPPPFPQQPTSLTSLTANGEVSRDLIMEVQQRLERLRQSLRI